MAMILASGNNSAKKTEAKPIFAPASTINLGELIVLKSYYLSKKTCLNTQGSEEGILNFTFLFFPGIFKSIINFFPVKREKSSFKKALKPTMLI